MARMDRYRRRERVSNQCSQQPVAVGPDGPGRFFAVAHAKIFPTDPLFALNRPCMIVSWQMFDSSATFRFRLQKIRHGFPLKLKQR